jgi:uncharacterized membrane protein YeaQ/YmgE (transglycosylase-associated protein family)
MSLSTLIVWLVIGAIAGSLTGAVFKGSKHGYGTWGNLGIGLAGALIGGIVFRVFGIDIGLGAIAVSLEDIVAAILGSIVFIVILRIYRSRRSRGQGGE